MVTGLKTEGGGSADKSVTAFKVQTGKTACSLSYILEGGFVKVIMFCFFVNDLKVYVIKYLYSEFSLNCLAGIFSNKYVIQSDKKMCIVLFDLEGKPPLLTKWVTRLWLCHFIIQEFTTSYKPTTHDFPQPVSARFVRIEPTNWAEYAGLRFEVMGCLSSSRETIGKEQHPVCSIKIIDAPINTIIGKVVEKSRYTLHTIGVNLNR